MLPVLPYTFHDSWLIEVRVGPRREVVMGAFLDAMEQEPAISGIGVRLRFGAIENFDEIRAFFSALQKHEKPPLYYGRIDWLGYDRDEPLRSNRLVLRINLERHGSAVIRCRNVAAWPDPELKD